MSNLTLNLKREYFDLIKSGEKKFEYRLINEYWYKRLSKPHDKIIICLGYPPKEDSSRRIEFPYNGFEETVIKHKHFGDDPVRVYAIPLEVDRE